MSARDIKSPVTTSTVGSLWLDDDASAPRAPLRGDVAVDVVVIGGGIAGITTALLCARDGARVAVVEARRVASGVTGCNTAKVTALQSSVYSTIRRRQDQDRAAQAGWRPDRERDAGSRPAGREGRRQPKLARRHHGSSVPAGGYSRFVDGPSGAVTKS
jgi:glycine/D-amino acid oxidase-like deaminating enzyme